MTDGCVREENPGASVSVILLVNVCGSLFLHFFLIPMSCCSLLVDGPLFLCLLVEGQGCFNDFALSAGLIGRLH